MDLVFKALADPTRRLLLDRLREHNGQTLSGLCERLGMARQSATQHLDILERRWRTPTGAGPGGFHARIRPSVQDVVVSQLSVPVRLVASVRALGPVGERWMDELPGLLARLESEWSITCGAAFDGGNASYVAEALRFDGVPAVLKVALPSGVDGFSAFEQELETLRLADGDPYVAVIRHDTKRRRCCSNGWESRWQAWAGPPPTSSKR